MNLRQQFTDFTYTGGTRPCRPMTIIFGSVIQSQHTSLNINVGVNRTFQVLKTPVYRFEFYGRYRTLVTDDDNFWQCCLSKCTSLNIKFGVNRTFHVLKTPVTDLTYMGGTGPCRPMTIIFGGLIQSQYTSQNIKFGVNQTFHVLKTTIYRFDLYGGYQTLWTDDDNFWQCYLELVYKPKY